MLPFPDHTQTHSLKLRLIVGNSLFAPAACSNISMIDLHDELFAYCKIRLIFAFLQKCNLGNVCGIIIYYTEHRVHKTLECRSCVCCFQSINAFYALYFKCRTICMCFVYVFLYCDATRCIWLRNKLHM